jgi:hypothetical protein
LDFDRFRCKTVQFVTLSGELDGTILGTFPNISAPLWAPFDAG